MIAKPTADPLTTIKIALVGGLVCVLIALEGMVQAFSTRNIIHDNVTMGHTLLVIAVFVTAYLALSRSRLPQRIFAVFVGPLCGTLCTAMIVVLIWLGGFLPLGSMFINATPALYDLLTFKQGATTGSIILLVVGAVAGLAAVVLFLLPSNARRSVISGLSVVVGLGVLQDLVTTTLSNSETSAALAKFLYASNGLSTTGALTVFVLVAVGSYFWALSGPQARERMERLPAATQRLIRWSLVSIGLLIVLFLPQILGLYFSEVLDNVGIYLLMGLGLNIVVGFAGLLDLGYVAFFALGAYTVGVLTSPELGHSPILTSWWAALPLGVLVALVAGVLLGIPVLRMRGDYLAIVTLGFGEIVRLLFLSDWLKPYLGGSQGVLLITKPSIGPVQIINPPEFYYIILAGCLLAVFVAGRVKTSRIGRAWMAVREDEDVAQAMGIQLVATKLMAFGMGAAFGGLSGAIFASKLGSVFPHSFNFLVSVNVLSLIIIGGMGSIPGVVVGALAFVGLPELLREFSDYRYLFYGLALVIMMLVRPEGLLPEARRRLELEAFKEEGSAPVQPPLIGEPSQTESVVESPGR